MGREKERERTGERKREREGGVTGARHLSAIFAVNTPGVSSGLGVHTLVYLNPTSAKQKKNTTKSFNDFDLKAKAGIWP